LNCLADCPNLRRLDLGGRQIGSEAIPALLELPPIKTIDVIDTDLSEADVKRLETEHAVGSRY
jgi:hypothetical protein